MDKIFIKQWLQKYKYVLIAVGSFILGLLIVFNGDMLSFFTNYLSEKTNQVLGLTTLSSAAATTISLLPGDAGTPIANTLINFSGILLVILVAVMMEKAVMVLTSGATLMAVVPLFCGIMHWAENTQKESWRAQMFARKMLAAFLSLTLVVPVSVGLSIGIEKIYDDPVSVTLEQGQEIVDEVEEEATENKSWWDQTVSSVQKGWNDLTQGVTNTIDQMKNVVRNFMESIAVMVITSLVIPVLSYFVMYLIIKAALGKERVEQIKDSAVIAAGKTKKFMTEPHIKLGHAADKRSVPTQAEYALEQKEEMLQEKEQADS